MERGERRDITLLGEMGETDNHLRDYGSLVASFRRENTPTNRLTCVLSSH